MRRQGIKGYTGIRFWRRWSCQNVRNPCQNPAVKFSKHPEIHCFCRNFQAIHITSEVPFLVQDTQFFSLARFVAFFQLFSQPPKTLGEKRCAKKTSLMIHKRHSLGSLLFRKILQAFYLTAFRDLRLTLGNPTYLAVVVKGGFNEVPCFVVSHLRFPRWGEERPTGGDNQRVPGIGKCKETKPISSQDGVATVIYNVAATKRTPPKLENTKELCFNCCFKRSNSSCRNFRINMKKAQQCSHLLAILSMDWLSSHFSIANSSSFMVHISWHPSISQNSGKKNRGFQPIFQFLWSPFSGE